MGWSHGNLVAKSVEPMPNGPDDARRDLLDSASEIVNAIAPELFAQRRAELEKKQKKSGRGWKKKKR